MFESNITFRLVENPQGSWMQGGGTKKKVLVQLWTREVVSSYGFLEQVLMGLGWKGTTGEPELFQFHKRNSIDLISFPSDFTKFNSVYIYDIVHSLRV
ncbi:hypothetical protein SAY86_018943 [Trapa natans]|uniref:Uncharacterized protein n=1 Tax=Trapa natans TaxID=22666 RepID=A0AAN7LFY0_TRANT|nr:hypothetical protein SAY86_018943 [Trapa natans]